MFDKWSGANSIRKVEVKFLATHSFFSSLSSRGGLRFFTHGISAHLDAMGIVHQAVEDAVGEGPISPENRAVAHQRSHISHQKIFCHSVRLILAHSRLVHHGCPKT